MVLVFESHAQSLSSNVIWIDFGDDSYATQSVVIHAKRMEIPSISTITHRTYMYQIASQ